MLCQCCTLLTVQEQQWAGCVYAGTVHCWQYKSSNRQAVLHRYCTLLTVQEQQSAGCVYAGTVHCWQYKSSKRQAVLHRFCILLTVQEQQWAGCVTPVLYITDGTRAAIGRLCYAGTVHCWRYKSSNGQAVLRRYCTLLTVQQQQWAGCIHVASCWCDPSQNQ